MATVLKAVFFVVVVLLYRGHDVHGQNNGAAVHDVTVYGASPGSKDNKRVSWRPICPPIKADTKKSTA